MKKNIKISFKIFVIAILLLNISNSLQISAQPSGKVIFDNKGTDFWLSFLPNFHNNINSTNSKVKFGDSLYIFLVADTVTTGRITYYDRAGIEYTHNFNITNPDEVYTFKISYYDFETWGYNISGRIVNEQNEENFCEKVSYASFHIQCDKEITVYAHSQANTTSDAFMVLPTDVLGNRYYVLSYNSDGSIFGGGQNTPSQFLIVASEDNTNVTIKPSTETYRYGKTRQDITLNKGEVYLVQAKMEDPDFNRDLTGTEIISNKPVAVFAGHQRATVPLSTALSSRDCLIEQVLPLNTWGKNALLAPYPTPFNATDRENDLFRVLFSTDNTELYINDNFVGTFNAAEYYEAPLNKAIYIQASQPILVAGYKKTGQDRDHNNSDSDPFMMIIPPIEQYLKEYLVTNIQAWEYDFNGLWGNYQKVYDMHYITIIAHKDDLDSIFIDNIIVNPNLFRKFPTIDYFYANIPVNEGSHKITASGKVGIYIYGYGYANSYGYTGGLSLVEYDFKEPEIFSIDSCYKFYGTAYDTAYADTKLREVNFRNTINVKTNVENSKNRDSLSFSAELINKYEDGYFEIYAVDSVYQENSKAINLRGFTISLDDVGSKDSVIKISGDFRVLREFCYQFQLKNYGNFDHLITGLDVNNLNVFSFNLLPPFVLKSIDEKTLEVCFRSDVIQKIKDTLTIYDDCGFRNLIVFDLNFVGDTIPPKIDYTADSCNNLFNYFITDTNSFDWGLKSVEILDTTNCKLDILEVTYNTYNLKMEVVDPYKDAIITIIAKDSLDHTTVLSDTIQGFTIDFPQFVDAENLIDFKKQDIGLNACDTIVIRNYGILPFVINNIYIKGNVKFSIPQYQFPLSILPGEQVPIIACFSPDEAFEVYNDTLIITKNCLEHKITLIGVGDTLQHRGEADCDVDLIAVASKIATSYKTGRVYPNPVSDEINVPVFHDEISNIDLSIYNTLGIKVFENKFAGLPKGWNVIKLDLSDYPSGNYFIVLNKNSKVTRIQFVKE